MPARVVADFLIVGSGIAGLRAAVALAPHGRVAIVTKSNPSAGSTGFAQGGVAAAVGPDDSPDLHAQDTMIAGDGLCDEAAVRVLVSEGPRYVRELVDWGTPFDRDAHGQLALAREGAHAVRRVLHVRDATGREIGRTLAHKVFRHPNVQVLDHALVAGLTSDDSRVTGVECVDESGRSSTVSARAVLLATGGAGQVFEHTTNPDVATGDGMALGYLAGARVADLEFIQFHPTAIDIPGHPRHLLSEALRGEGARLINEAGEAFMTRYDPRGDLAPRDRVSRAIVLERERSGGRVFLTLAHLPAAAVHEGFPQLTEQCRRLGLDLATDRIPVGPAAHYVMGGLVTDLEGRTSLPGLFAAGEVARTGVHGANRLASNSLLEGLVFGGRAGEAMHNWDGKTWPADRTRLRPTMWGTKAAAAPGIDESSLRHLMWTTVGVFRAADALGRTVATLQSGVDAIEAALARGASVTPAAWRLISLVLVASLMAKAALRREESRGGHSRTDFPAKDDLHWKHSVSDVR